MIADIYFTLTAARYALFCDAFTMPRRRHLFDVYERPPRCFDVCLFDAVWHDTLLALRHFAPFTMRHCLLFTPPILIVCFDDCLFYCLRLLFD